MSRNLSRGSGTLGASLGFLQRSASLSTSPRPSSDLDVAQEQRKNARRRQRRQRESNPFEEQVTASPRPPVMTDSKETATTLPMSGEKISLFRQQVQAWSSRDAETEGTKAKHTSLPSISNIQGS